MARLQVAFVTLTTLWGVVSSRGRGRRDVGQSCKEHFDPQARVNSVGNGATEERGIVERGYGLPNGAMLGNHIFMYTGAFGIAHANGMALRHRPFPLGKG